MPFRDYLPNFLVGQPRATHEQIIAQLSTLPKEELFSSLPKLSRGELSKAADHFLTVVSTPEDNRWWQVKLETHFPERAKHVLQERSPSEEADISINYRAEFILQYYAHYHSLSERARYLFTCVKESTLPSAANASAASQSTSPDFIQLVERDSTRQSLLALACKLKHQAFLDYIYQQIETKYRSERDRLVYTEKRDIDKKLPEQELVVWMCLLNQIENLNTAVEITKIDINAFEKEGSTLLQLAMDSHHEEMTMLLLRLGAIPRIEDLIKCHNYGLTKKVIEANSEVYFDFYYKRDDDDCCLSLFELAYLHSDDLFLAILNHPSMLTRKDHDIDALIRRLVDVVVRGDEVENPLIKFIEGHVLPQQTIPESDMNRLPAISTDIATAPRDNLEESLATFPQADLWRLFYDGAKQKDEIGWVNYEVREPGFLAAMTRSFISMLDSIDEELSIGILVHLHACATQKVSNLQEGVVPGQFRDQTEIGFGFALGAQRNCTLAGLFELIELTKKTKHGALNSGVVRGFRCPARPRAEIEADAVAMIDSYNADMKTIREPLPKLKRIARLIANLERLHPFADGNCRTICILSLNRELIRHGFSPVILDDPNIFDGFSNDECVLEIIKGLQTYTIVKSGDTSSLGKSTDEILHAIDTDAGDGSDNYTKIWESSCDAFSERSIGQPIIIPRPGPGT